MATNTTDAASPPFILTRYLYSKNQVLMSLFIALLDHNIDEALFWAYEIYYSGFESEAFEFLYQTYETIYKKKNPALQKYIEKLVEEWNADNGKEWNLATLVATIATRTYSLDDFISTYFKAKCAPSISSPPEGRPKLRVRYNKECIELYRTKPPTAPLQTACKYSTRNDLNRLMDIEMPETDVFNTNWLYYAGRSPVWEARIKEHNGIIDDETKTVNFERDEQEEAFYEAWPYQPDELSAELKQKRVGYYAKNVEQMLLTEFCGKYGVELVIRKLIIKAKPIKPQ